MPNLGGIPSKFLGRFGPVGPLHHFTAAAPALVVVLLCTGRRAADLRRRKIPEAGQGVFLTSISGATRGLLRLWGEIRMRFPDLGGCPCERRAATVRHAFRKGSHTGHYCEPPDLGVTREWTPRVRH